MALSDLRHAGSALVQAGKQGGILLLLHQSPWGRATPGTTAGVGCAAAPPPVRPEPGKPPVGLELGCGKPPVDPEHIPCRF